MASGARAGARVAGRAPRFCCSKSGPARSWSPGRCLVGRAAGMFVAVNCAAIPASQRVELFGHVKSVYER